MIGYESTPLSHSGNAFKFAFVGYADILGFAKMLKGQERAKQIIKAYSRIKDLLQNVETTSFPIEIGTLRGFGEEVGSSWYNIITPDTTHIFMISDSIFFVLIPHRFASEIIHQYGLVSALLMSRILSILWHFDLPARGALSDGNVYFDSSRSIFIGEPIVRAVRWESVQSFVWFTAEPLSTLAQTVSHHPNGLIGKAASLIEIGNPLFNADRLEKYRADCGQTNLASTFTYCPDPSFLSPDKIRRSFDSYREQEDSKEKTYWMNTEELFLKIDGI